MDSPAQHPYQPATPSLAEKMAALRSRLDRAAGSAAPSGSPAKAEPQTQPALQSPGKKTLSIGGPRIALAEQSAPRQTAPRQTTLGNLAANALSLPASAPIPKNKRTRALASPAAARFQQKEHQAQHQAHDNSPNPRAKKTGRKSEPALVAKGRQRTDESWQDDSGEEGATASAESDDEQQETAELDGGKQLRVKPSTASTSVRHPRKSAPTTAKENSTAKSAQFAKEVEDGDDSFIQEIKERGWGLVAERGEEEEQEESPVRVRWIYPAPVKERKAVKKESLSSTAVGKKKARASAPPKAPRKSTAKKGAESEADQTFAGNASMSNTSVRIDRKSRESTLPPPAKIEMLLNSAMQPESPGDDPLLLKGPSRPYHLSVVEALEDEEMGEASFSKETVERQMSKSRGSQEPYESVSVEAGARDGNEPVNWMAEGTDEDDEFEEQEEEPYFNGQDDLPLMDDYPLPDELDKAADEQQESSHEVSKELGDLSVKTPAHVAASSGHPEDSAEDVADELQLQALSSQQTETTAVEREPVDDGPPAHASKNFTAPFATDDSHKKAAYAAEFDSDEDIDDSIELIGHSSNSRSRDYESVEDASPDQSSRDTEVLPSEALDENRSPEDSSEQQPTLLDEELAEKTEEDAGASDQETVGAPLEGEAEEEAAGKEVDELDEIDEIDDQIDASDASMDSFIVDQSIAAVGYVPRVLPVEEAASDEGIAEDREEQQEQQQDISMCETSTLPLPGGLPNPTKEGHSDQSSISMTHNAGNVPAERSAMLSRIKPTPIVEISSMDADAAARAAAILKHHYKYIEEGVLTAQDVANAGDRTLAELLHSEEARLQAKPAVVQTPAPKPAIVPKTPHAPGAYLFSPAPPSPLAASTATSTSELRSWKRRDWSALEKLLVQEIEKLPAWTASRDAPSRAAAVRGVDRLEIVTTFLLSPGIRRSQLPSQGDWSEKSMQARVHSLQKMICRHVDDLSPGTLQSDLSSCRRGRSGTPSEMGSQLSFDDSNAIAGTSFTSHLGMPGAIDAVARAAARISLSEAIARGSHSTPIARSRMQALPNHTQSEMQDVSTTRATINPIDILRVKQKLNATVGPVRRADEAPSNSSGIFAGSKAARSAMGDISNMSNTSTSLYPKLPGAFSIRTSQGGQSQVRPTSMTMMGPEAVKEAKARVTALKQSRDIGVWESPLTVRKRLQEEAKKGAGQKTVGAGEITFEHSRTFWNGRQ